VATAKYGGTSRGQKSRPTINCISFVICLSRWNVASTINSDLCNTTLLITKSEKKLGRLQLASNAGCKKSLSKYLVWCWPDLSHCPFWIFNICTENTSKNTVPCTANKKKRKWRIGSKFRQANITLNISTNYALQPAIEANCKRPTVRILWFGDLQYREP
jgi:hypothetical protein